MNIDDLLPPDQFTEETSLTLVHYAVIDVGYWCTVISVCRFLGETEMIAEIIGSMTEGREHLRHVQ